MRSKSKKDKLCDALLVIADQLKTDRQTKDAEGTGRHYTTAVQWMLWHYESQIRTIVRMTKE